MSKGARILALLAGGSLALSACATGGGDPEPGDEGGDDAAQGPADVTITAAHEQEFSAYNNNTAESNAVKNTVVLNQVLRGFWYFGEDGTVVPDTEFGTYELVQEEPLTVAYTINENAIWSDGEPIDCDDFLLAWAAFSGTYTTGEDADGDGTEDPLFNPASTAGYELMQKPDCSEGDREFEVVYDEPYADWQAVVGSFMPAHVAEEQAGVEDVIAAIETDDIELLTPIAEFWNTGWIFDPGELPQELIPSAGPYLLSSWDTGQSITLEANPEWWGTPPASSTITLRFIPQEEQAAALANGEIQIAEPQPNPDIVEQLTGLPGVEVLQGQSYTYEHLDMNFTGIFSDPNLREAFISCVPRDLIVQNLIAPVNPEVEVMDARIVFPFQPTYQDVVSESYDGQYDTADVEHSAQILADNGLEGTVVRIGYQAPNQRRTNEVDLIRSSCNEAGFDIQDAGSETFFDDELPSGNFDVALFAWAGSPLVAGTGTQLWATDGGGNYMGYSNPEMDELSAALDVTSDPEEQTAIITQMEAILWEDLVTVPIFAFPGIAAHQENIENVIFQPSQTQITWNMHQWSVAE